MKLGIGFGLRFGETRFVSAAESTWDWEGGSFAELRGRRIGGAASVLGKFREFKLGNLGII